MDETQAPAPSTAAKKTKEERSRIAQEAAKRRWAKAKREKAKQAAAKSKGVKAKKQTGPREFSSALKMAEKRLVKALQERAEYGARYAVVSAEIPSLQRIILALKGGPAVGYAEPAVTLEQIVGDQPLAYQNPPVTRSNLPVQPMQHPVTTQGRAMGGAIGIEIPDEDEDKFLETSGVAGGNWHAG